MRPWGLRWMSCATKGARKAKEPNPVRKIRDLEVHGRFSRNSLVSKDPTERLNKPVHRERSSAKSAGGNLRQWPEGWPEAWPRRKRPRSRPRPRGSNCFPGGGGLIPAERKSRRGTDAKAAQTPRKIHLAGKRPGKKASQCPVQQAQAQEKPETKAMPAGRRPSLGWRRKDSGKPASQT